MLVRAIALSLALLVGIGVIVPLATDTTEAGSRKSKKSKKRGWKGVKKYSKRWWQLYRAQERRKRSLRARKRNLNLRQLRMARERAVDPASTGVKAMTKRTAVQKPSTTAAVLPSGDKAPEGWRPAQSSPAELQFRVDNSSGSQVGSASITIVGPAVGNGMPDSRNRTVGGVQTTSLRREVIDRMIRENGWVVNDYQKQISGQQV